MALAAIALIGLRVWIALTLRVNSDEPQHLHVVWEWTQGALPYRDFFDNHAPFFQVLYAPILALLGERSDIVPLMRLAVLPWYFLTLWLTYRLARSLFDRRVGWAAMLLAALQPTFFLRSAEFRPDDAWATVWIAAVLVAVGGRPTLRRAFGCGLLLGLAAAFSIKSALLIAAALIAAAIVLAVLLLRGRAPAWRAILRTTAAGAAGSAVLPLAIAGLFAAAGAWDALVHCLFVHNVPAGLGRWAHVGADRWILPLLLLLLTAVLYRLLGAHQQRDARMPLRAWLIACALVYLALRAGYQPLLDKQDLLPVIPLVAIFAAALMLTVPTRPSVQRVTCTLVATAIAVEMLLVFDQARPWRDEARAYAQELATLLRLSKPGEFVMDDKGEAIFRPRPYYWILENVTLFRIAHGSIADDIAARLAADRIDVGVFDRESGADRAFVRANYVAIAPHVDVAGQLLGPADAGDRVVFDITVADRYALLAEDGAAASGTLDGSPYSAPRELQPGSHEFIPDRDSNWALESAQAAELGYRPFHNRQNAQ